MAGNFLHMELPFTLDCFLRQPTPCVLTLTGAPSGVSGIAAAPSHNHPGLLLQVAQAALKLQGASTSPEHLLDQVSGATHSA